MRRRAYSTLSLAPILSVLLASVAVLLPIAGAAQTTPDNDLTNEQKLALFGKMRRCTVKVKARIKDNLYHIGTGVAIKRSDDFVVIVTNAHVVQNDDGPGLSPQVTLETWNKLGELEAKILIAVQMPESKLDVAVLIANDWSHRLEVAEMNTGIAAFLKRGTPVYACGNPRGEEFLPTIGKITAVHDDPTVAEMPTIEHDALIEHGSSGGGLFDSDGKLLGINTWILGDGRTGVAVPVTYFVARWPVYQTYVRADRDWTDLGIDVDAPHSLVRAMAVGRWDVNEQGDFVYSNGAGQTLSERFDDRFPFGCLLLRFGDEMDSVAHTWKPSDGKVDPRGMYHDAFFGMIAKQHGRVAFRINIKDNSHCSGRLQVFTIVIPSYRP